MSARKAKQNMKAGLQQMEGLMDSLMNEHLKPDSPRSKVALVVGFCVHLLILAFTVVLVWTAKPSSSLFSWHPTLMTIAFGVLMPEAILLFSPWSSPVANGTPRTTLVRWHWVAQVCMALTAITGFIIITGNKMLNNYNHYTSWHGSMGLYLISALTFQMSGGIIHMYPEILPFKIRLVTLKRIHALFGTLIFIGGMAVLSLGLYTTWFVANTDANVWTFCVGCLALIGLYVFAQVVKNHVWCKRQ